MPLPLAVVVLCVLATTSFALRLLLQIDAARRRRREVVRGGLPKEDGVISVQRRRLLAILGSGGHTAEMLNMVRDVCGADDDKKRTRKLEVTYATADEGSARRAAAAGVAGEVMRLPRARHVGEPFWHAAPRAAACTLHALLLVARVRPDVVLCNGPATGAVVCVAAILLNAAGLTRARIVYAESVARVDTLSLSGKVLYPVVHRFLVQWPQLARRYPLAEWRGRFS